MSGHGGVWSREWRWVGSLSGRVEGRLNSMANAGVVGDRWEGVYMITQPPPGEAITFVSIDRKSVV